MKTIFATIALLFASPALAQSTDYARDGQSDFDRTCKPMKATTICDVDGMMAWDHETVSMQRVYSNVGDRLVNIYVFKTADADEVLHNVSMVFGRGQIAYGRTAMWNYRGGQITASVTKRGLTVMDARD